MRKEKNKKNVAREKYSWVPTVFTKGFLFIYLYKSRRYACFSFAWSYKYTSWGLREERKKKTKAVRERGLSLYLFKVKLHFESPLTVGKVERIYIWEWKTRQINIMRVYANKVFVGNPLVNFQYESIDSITLRCWPFSFFIYLFIFSG